VVTTAAGAALPVNARAQEPASAAAGEQEVALEGLWQVDIELDSAQAAREGRPRRISGTIALRAAPRRPNQPGSSTVVYPGTYDIKLDELGIVLRSNVALAWYAGRGDVRVQLNPSVGGGSLLLRGHIEGGIVSGTWTYEGERQRITGRFSMKRG